MAKILVYVAVLGSSLILGAEGAGVGGAYTMWKKGSLVKVKLNPSRPSLLQRSNNMGGNFQKSGWKLSAAKPENFGSAFRKEEGGFHQRPKPGMPGNIFGEFVPQTNTKRVPSWLKRRLTASPSGIDNQVAPKGSWRSSGAEGSVSRSNFIDLSKPKAEYFGSKLPFFEPLRLSPRKTNKKRPTSQSPEQCIPEPSNNYCEDFNAPDGKPKAATSSFNNSKSFGTRLSSSDMKASNQNRRYRLIGY